MAEISIFLCMIFLHIFDDFKMQGILAQFKSRDYWAKNAPEPLYRHDWLISLVCHCASWAFMIMFPIMVWFNFVVPLWFACVFVINVIIHAIIDHLKANAKKINLCTDQICHFIQIIFTFSIFLFLR